MQDDQDAIEKERDLRSHAPFNVAAFALTFLFVWLVFKNFALGLLIGLMFSGGSEVAQRARDKKSE